MQPLLRKGRHSELAVRLVTLCLQLLPVVAKKIILFNFLQVPEKLYIPQNVFPFAPHAAVHLLTAFSIFVSLGHLGDSVEGIPTPGGSSGGNKRWSLLDCLLKASSTIGASTKAHPAGSGKLALGARYSPGAGTGMGMPRGALRAGGPGHTTVSKEGCATSRSQRPRIEELKATGPEHQPAGPIAGGTC